MFTLSLENLKILFESELSFMGSDSLRGGNCER